MREQGQAKARTGEQIYRQMCASCHGAAGEGTDDHYPRPLIGERSVASLAKLIAKTMPEDEPGTCVGPDADKVSAYIHDAFYSKAAQARHPMRPARIELSRLTVRQYKNALADLIGGPRIPPAGTIGAGSRGIIRGRHAVAEAAGAATTGSTGSTRRSAFTSASDSPIPAQNAVKEQSRRYIPLPALPVPANLLRAVLAGVPDQLAGLGAGARDGRIRARGPHRERRAALGQRQRQAADRRLGEVGQRHRVPRDDLPAGRPGYPLELELSKGKEKTASIELLWKVPRRGLEVIPARSLSPADAPEVYVARTPFPPDDRSVGYERGTSISKAWDQATTDAALEAADFVAGHLKDVVGIPDGASDRTASRGSASSARNSPSGRSGDRSPTSSGGCTSTASSRRPATARWP